MNGVKRHTFTHLSRQINGALANDDIFSNLGHSVSGIVQIMKAIHDTKGEQWASEVKDDKGIPLLSREEQQRFTEAFQPYLKDILAFFETPTHKGGNIDPTVANLTGLSEDELQSKMNTIGSTASDPSGHPDQMVGIDDIYAKIMDRIGRVDATINDYASQYGILHLEKEHDLGHDFQVIPDPLVGVISSGVGSLTATGPIGMQKTAEFLKKIKIPFRTIVFAIHLFLDITRVTAGMSGMDYNRKVLSILVSLLELLRGDWKKAILSFIGYYGMTPMLFGQVLKVFITLFRMLSPTLQDTFLFGALDSTKSLLIGFLLAIFQITASEEVRLPLIGMMEKIARKKAEIDGILVEEGLSARADHFAPTFEDFNNLQSLMDDPEFICSTEYEELIEQVDKTSVIHMILQILRIPVTKEFRQFRCGTKPSKPFLTMIVSKAKEDKRLQEKFEKPFSDENAMMPVAVSTDQSAVSSTEEPVETPAETPTEEPLETPVEEPTETPVEEPTETPVEEPLVETPAEEPVVETPVETPVEETVQTPVKEIQKEVPLPPTIKGGRKLKRRSIRRSNQFTSYSSLK